MGSYHVSSADLAIFQALMIFFYSLSLLGVVYSVFGAIRTASTRLPLSFPDNGFNPRLFPMDTGPRLYNSSGPGKKVWKVIVFAWFGFCCIIVFADVLFATYLAGDRWFGWSPTRSVTLTASMHALILVVATVPFALRARSHANKH